MVHHGVIENCTLYNNGRGIRLDESSKNTILENTVELSRVSGIYIYRNSNDNLVQNNSISKNDYDSSYGIYIHSSNNNVIIGNDVFDNHMAIYFGSSENNLFANNTCEINNMGIYFSGSNNNIIHGNNLSLNSYAIIFYSSRNNIISGNMVTYNSEGIYLEDYSTSNKILDNIVEYNSGNGILTYRCYSGIEIINNTVRANGNHGLYLNTGTGHKIYHNNIIDNNIQVYFDEAGEWDNGYPDGGNYYSDWSGPDEHCGPGQDMHGSDGITDEPRVLGSIGGYEVLDNYPWLEPNGWLVAAPRVTLVKPTGGEAWKVGTEEEIVWTTTKGYGNINNIYIQFSNDSGETWTNIVNETDDTGGFMWSLPEVSTNEAIIRVIVHDDNNRSGYNTSGLFTIATIPTAPIDLEAEAANEQVALVWNPPVEDGGSPLTNYCIYRGTESGQLSLHDEVDSDTTTYTDTGLTNGVTYYYSVSAVNSVGESGESEEVYTTPRTVPSVPQNFTASASDGQVNLSWESPVDNGGLDITEYRIYWGTSTNLLDNEIIRDAEDPTYYIHEWLDNGVTYYYRISAANQAGEGVLSDMVDATPRSLPSTPRDFVASSGDREIYLEWNPPYSDGGSDILGYRIYRGTNQDELTLHDTVNSQTTTYTDTGLTNGVTYFYQISSFVHDGEGALSEIISSVPMVVPSAPRNPVAVPGTGEITVNWDIPNSDGGSGIIHYRIYRGTTSGSLSFHSIADFGTNSYTDTNLVSGIVYYYHIRAVNDAGESIPSHEVNAIPKGITSPPLNLETSPSDGTIHLTWNQPANTGGCEITQYRIYRGATPDLLSLSGTVTGENTVYTDAGLTNGITYYYHVRTVNEIGESTPSNEVGNTPGSIPSSPRDVIASPIDRIIHLSWNPPANTGGYEIIQYRIYRGNTSGTLSLCGTVNGETTEYTDPSVADGTRYYYHVIAVNDIGESDVSVEVSAELTVDSDDPTGFLPDYWWIIVIAIIVIVSTAVLTIILFRGKKETTTTEPLDEVPSPEKPEEAISDEADGGNKVEYKGWLPP